MKNTWIIVFRARGVDRRFLRRCWVGVLAGRSFRGSGGASLIGSRGDGEIGGIGG